MFGQSYQQVQCSFPDVDNNVITTRKLVNNIQSSVKRNNVFKVKEAANIP